VKKLKKARKVKKMKIKAIGGDIIKVDISDRACQPFGFAHGDKVIDPFGNKGTIMGVAPKYYDHGPDTLWYATDSDGNQAGYWGEDKNYRDAGFRLAEGEQEVNS